MRHPLCPHALLASFLTLQVAALELSVSLPDSPGPVWKRHTVDDTSEGADGVRLGDLNGDGLTDIVTGWEEGGVVRAYLNPGPEQARAAWPQVTVGEVLGAEDAFFADLTGTGRLDVISLTEEKPRNSPPDVKARTVYRHRFSGSFPDELLDPQKWRTDPFPATLGKQSWMQGAPADLDGRHGNDLVLASKGPTAAVGWLQSPAQEDDLAAWTWHVLRPSNWIMSIILHDMDGDGDLDIVFSDRRNRSGVFWLENPGVEAVRRHDPWTEHPIAAIGRKEVMFAGLADINGNGLMDVVVAVKPHDIVIALRQPDGGWEEQTLTLNQKRLGTAKAVKAGDLNGNGRIDLVFSCEDASSDREGVVWLEQLADGGWMQHRLSGPEGVKFDDIRLLDLDGDGDLDILTCEEAAGLGVIWYENPSR